jgi:hypothetical protein
MHSLERAPSYCVILTGRVCGWSAVILGIAHKSDPGRSDMMLTENRRQAGENTDLLNDMYLRPVLIEFLHRRSPFLVCGDE